MLFNVRNARLKICDHAPFRPVPASHARKAIGAEPTVRFAFLLFAHHVPCLLACVTHSFFREYPSSLLWSLASFPRRQGKCVLWQASETFMQTERNSLAYRADRLQNACLQRGGGSKLGAYGSAAEGEFTRRSDLSSRVGVGYVGRSVDTCLMLWS